MGPRALLPLFAFTLALVCAALTWPVVMVGAFVLGSIGGALVAIGTLCGLLPDPVRKAAVLTIRNRVRDTWC